MRFIDVHCHLDGEVYGNTDLLFDRFAAEGIQRVITVGFDLPSSYACRALAEKYESCYFTAGFHPTELKKYREGALEEIAALARHKKCVAIGEIGLDYHYPDTNKPLQREIFVRQLEMAAELGLPVQIHSRDCAEDMLELLKQNRDKLRCGALMHCFSHSAEIAAELEKLGLWFSFGGTCTYSGSKRARKAIAAISAERLLTETDSPYLAPKSRQGDFPNTPLSIPEIAQTMAAVRGVPAAELTERVWQNAHTLFPKLH